MKFDHIGMPTSEKQKDEIWVDATKVWVTDYKKHPYKVEWLRFREDSPVKGKVRNMPHVAYQVEELKEAAKGLEVLLEPFDVGFATVGFYEFQDGAVVEFMQYKEQEGD
jgi:hypothetical protein